MDINKYRRILRDGDANEVHKGYKGIEWVEEEVKRIRKISNLKEQVKEAEKIYKICDNVYCSLTEGGIPNGVRNGFDGFDNLKSLCEELRYLKNQPIKETKNNSSTENKSQSCSFCNAKSKLYHLIYNEITNSLQWATVLSTGNNIEKVFCNQGCFDGWWKIKYSNKKPIRTQKSTNINNLKDNYEQNNYEPTNNTGNETCAECEKNLKAGDEYYYKKNDNKKFCSTDCYDKHYKIGKTELGKKEEVLNAYEAIRKELFEKTPVVSSEEVLLPPADAVYKLLEQKKEVGQLQTYLQQKLAEIKQIRFDKSNNHRERERERAKHSPTATIACWNHYLRAKCY